MASRLLIALVAFLVGFWLVTARARRRWMD